MSLYYLYILLICFRFYWWLNHVGQKLISHNFWKKCLETHFFHGCVENNLNQQANSLELVNPFSMWDFSTHISLTWSSKKYWLLTIDTWLKIKCLRYSKLLIEFTMDMIAVLLILNLAECGTLVSNFVRSCSKWGLRVCFKFIWMNSLSFEVGRWKKIHSKYTGDGLHIDKSRESEGNV